jgi:CRISPR-associated endoribonuclease Cas6
VIKIHIDITLKLPENGITLPIHYNYLMQAAIYKSINDELADFLHSEGYISEKRVFRFFSFSKLKGKYNINTELGTITFYGPVCFTISSPIDRFCESLVNTLLTKGCIIFRDYILPINKISLRRLMPNENIITLKTLSPVVVYSTFLKPDNKKYTYYFRPDEPEFQNLVYKNLVNKYKALYNEGLVDETFKIKPFGKIRMHIINYKGFIIKAHSCNFNVTGSKETLQLLIDSGIGSKNSQGFGCVESI